MHAQGATFYIRLKAGNYAECDDQQLRIGELSAKDTTVRLFDLRLRVVRSPKSRKATEPWYILTNDMSSNRDTVVKIYYHRFEIEETFKDTKHLFGLHRLKFDRPTSLKVVLWLVFLGIALLYAVTKPPKQRKQHTTNPKKCRSWIRVAYEHFQRQLNLLRALTGLTPRYKHRGQV
ncbi:MAG: transposase [Candidatus Saccharibacteria bacterium]